MLTMITPPVGRLDGSSWFRRLVLTAFVVLSSESTGWADEPPSAALASNPINDSVANPATLGSATALRVCDRQALRDGSGWRVHYRLEVATAAPVAVEPGEVVVIVESDLSNARVPGLEQPRRSRLVARGDEGLVAQCDLDPTAEEARRSRERLMVELIVNPPRRSRFEATAESPGLSQDPTADPFAAPTAVESPAGPLRIAPATPDETGRRGLGGETIPAAAGPIPSLTLLPGATVEVVLLLSHHRFLYGRYEPLLGRRAIQIRLGELSFADRIDLDDDRPVPPPVHRLDGPQDGPPADRLDPSQYVSAPHSLHLEAHAPGNQSYRFKDQEVRYGTTMRLSFSYLVAIGSEGRVKARVSQYRDGPASSWRILPEGCVEIPLTEIGRWTRVETVFRTQNDATTIGLDFRIGGDIGEAWIDDIALEAIDDQGATQPRRP